MKTLIITVGTRQVGWRCADGTVRSLGGDGGSSPNHINELYTLELEQERESHPDNYSWSVRHLGEQLYVVCQLKQTFSPVELLIDDYLIAKEVKDGLTKVVLWGTDQPEDISWKFRRFDTLWLANLMAGKLRQLYPLLQVEVWNPVLAANNPIVLCQRVETYILNNVFDTIAEAERKNFTLLIENKGSVPLIANALEMCAVALSRQCHVKLIIPTEPDPLFIGLDNGYQTVQCSTHCSYLPIGKYFWPLEKPKIISAWQRGDFGEAQLWLSAHRDRYKPLYDLAEYLALAINGDIRRAVKQIQNQWGINGRRIKNLTAPEEHEKWLTLAKALQENNQSIHHKYAWIWERLFLSETEIKKHLYSNSFLSFAQVLEALLNLQYESEDWVNHGYTEFGREFPPSLWSLIQGWQKKNSITQDSPWVSCLDKIRQLRNKIAHEGIAVTLNEIDSVLSIISTSPTKKLKVDEITAHAVIHKMYFILEKVAHPASKLPQDILLRSLYQWGLDLLNSEQ